MEFWMYWKQICRIMAVLFIITALAGAAAAAILLVRARLYEKLAGEAGAKYRKTGILALIAVCVWITVIGLSASAAQTGSTQKSESEEQAGSTQQSASAAQAGSTQQSTPAAQAGSTQQNASAAQAGSTREQAAPEEPADSENSENPKKTDDTQTQEESDDPGDHKAPVDEQPPSVRIEMDRDANRGSDGNLYCREDNAGICVILEENGSADTGIKAYRIVVTDSQGREIIRQWSAGEAEENKRSVREEIAAQETAKLSDGEIFVRAEASDGAGSTTEAGQRFVLDTCPPVLTEMMTYRENAEADGDPDGERKPAEGGTLYDGRDLYYRDDALTTRIAISDENPVSWTISYLMFGDLGESADGGCKERQVTGEGGEGSITISEEGVYGVFRIYGEDAAGNKMRAAQDCRCTADTEDYYEKDREIRLARRKILDRTPPEAMIRFFCGAEGYAYEEKGGQTVYFAADAEASLHISDTCAGMKMPMEENKCRFVQWSAREGGADPGSGSAAGVGSAGAESAGVGSAGAESAAGSDNTGADSTGVNSAAGAERIEVHAGQTLRLSSDKRAWYGAYGTDRAGNGLVVREVFDTDIHTEGGSEKEDAPFSPSVIRRDQAGADLCLPGTGIVRDTVCPVLTAAISRPAGNPAGIDREHEIIYYSADPDLYGTENETENETEEGGENTGTGGEAAICLRFEVRDENAGEDRLELRTAYAKVPEGSSCEEMALSWEDAEREPVEAVRDEKDGQCLRLELRRRPGTPELGDGVYRFGITGTDKAGNPLRLGAAVSDPDKGGGAEDALFGVICEDSGSGSYMTGRKVVDTEAPAGEIRIQNRQEETYCRLTAHGSRWAADPGSFMPYRREKEAAVCFEAGDISPVSVSCRLLSTSGGRNDKAPDGSTYRNGAGERVEIRGGQIFRAEHVVFRDRAGNTAAVLERTVNFYLDTGLPRADIDAPRVRVTAITGNTSPGASGRPLYSGAVTLKVIAQDPDRKYGGSGLYRVSYDLWADGHLMREGEILMSGDAPVQDPKIEKEPVYAFSGEITVPSGGVWESNDLEVIVTAQDNAGNRSDPKRGGTFDFGIDSQSPEVTVTYDNNKVRNGKYFAGKRKAVILVRDRNFSETALQITAPGAVLGRWKRRTGGDGRESADIWVMEAAFEEDGAYTLNVGGADAAGNPALVRYTGEAPRDFVVDRTPPVIEVIWDNNDVLNGMYYNRERNAAVRITDLSFDERGVKIVPFAGAFTASDGGAFAASDGGLILGGGGAGTRTYETQVRFDREGEWRLACTCVDLAGNAAVPVLEMPFIIDMTPPRLHWDEAVVEEMGVYGEEVLPRLAWEEENPSDAALYALWKNLTAGGTIACRNAKAGKGKLSLGDAPREETCDGFCELVGTMCDLAGNRRYVRRNLIVNRYGSVYDISEDENTADMISRAYTAVSDKPFVVAEYSALPLTGRELTLFCNGVPAVLREGEDYFVTEQKRRTGIKYVYKIEPSCFCSEGRYSLLLRSKDEAGGQNASPGRFLRGEKGGAPYSPEWAVDQTAPQIRLAGVDAGQRRFMTDALWVDLIPSDNMELAGLRVWITDDRGGIVHEETIDKKALREILGNGEGAVKVRIDAAGNWQTLHAQAQDGAGHRSTGMMAAAGSGREEGTLYMADGYRVLVSSNLMVHIYRSGILPAASFLALAGLILYIYGVYKHTLT